MKIESDPDLSGVLPPRTPVPRHRQLQRIEKSFAIVAALVSALWHMQLYTERIEIGRLAAKLAMEQLMLEMFLVGIPAGLAYSYLTKKNFHKEVVGPKGIYRLVYQGESKLIEIFSEVASGLGIASVVWTVVGLGCLAISGLLN